MWWFRVGFGVRVVVGMGHHVSHMTVHGLLSDMGYRMHATVKRLEGVQDTPGYKNGGRQWPPKGKPEKAGTHDFPDPNRPKAIPYGVYDIGVHTGTGCGKSSWLVSQPTPGLIFMCVTTRLARLPEDPRHARMVIALGRNRGARRGAGTGLIRRLCAELPA